MIYNCSPENFEPKINAKRSFSYGITKTVKTKANKTIRVI